MSEWVAGSMSAAPTPWPARPAMSQLPPGASAQPSDASVNRASPVRKILRRPMKSASFPPVNSNVA